MFTNWSGSVSTRATIHQPHTEAELISLLSGPAPIRTVGAGHSFTPVAASDATMINLDHFSGLAGVDPVTQRVRFLAGTRLRDIPELLLPHGLALPNQGDVNPQSVAGAVSTGTHGTGLGFTGFAGMVTGVTIILADGTVRTVDETDPNFDLYQLTLGMCGIITEVELQCVDTFDMIASETPSTWEEMLDTFVERAGTFDHVEFFWFPGQEGVMLKENTRVAPDDPRPAPRRNKIAQVLTEEIVDNGILRAVCEAGRIFPSVTLYVNRAATALGSNRTYRAPAHEVFVSPRRVRFHEMEYAVPLEDGPAVLADLRHAIDNLGYPISMPVEVRCASADDVALSTAYQRDTMYIAVHSFVKNNPVDYFNAVEPIFKAAGGRPHWGKMHTLTRSEVEDRYPQLDRFRAFVAELDPEGLFATDYLSFLRP